MNTNKNIRNSQPAKQIAFGLKCAINKKVVNM